MGKTIYVPLPVVVGFSVMVVMLDCKSRDVVAARSLSSAALPASGPYAFRRLAADLVEVAIALSAELVALAWLMEEDRNVEVGVEGAVTIPLAGDGIWTGHRPHTARS